MAGSNFICCSGACPVTARAFFLCKRLEGLDDFFQSTSPPFFTPIASISYIRAHAACDVHASSQRTTELCKRSAVNS